MTAPQQIVQKLKKEKGLRVLLYVGRFRPESQTDFGAELIRRIRASRHTIAGCIFSRNDPLAVRVKRSGAPVFELLPMLDQPLSGIRADLRNRECRKKLAAWLAGLSLLRSDIGVSFYGSWMPPELFSLPALGFINYHPSPLPDLRGVEPDTFAVLEGRRKMWGTVHKVSEAYDEGSIVGRTAGMKVTRHMTPVVVLNTLTKYGISAILRALNRFHNNSVTFEKQANRQTVDAGRKRAQRESAIKWSSDDMDMIHRRLLAFCGQDIRIRLKADVGGKRYCVRDLEIHRGRFPGKPGDIIGKYCGRGKYFGQPIVRARGGVVAMDLGRAIGPRANSPEEPLSLMVPPRRRKQVTDIRMIRRSIRNIQETHEAEYSALCSRSTTMESFTLFRWLA